MPRFSMSCPTGATPPIANPVSARTESASALPMVSPSFFASFASSTRVAPLSITRIARPPGRSKEGLARKTSDFAICATEQPIAAAASAEVRVEAENSLISVSTPRSAKACRTRAVLDLPLSPDSCAINRSLLCKFPRPAGRGGNRLGHQRLQPVRGHQHIEGLEGGALGTGHILAELRRALVGEPRQLA